MNQHPGLERLDRQALQCLRFGGEVVADGDSPPEDPPPVVGGVTSGDQLVELCDRVDSWDRDEMTAAEPADLALHATFLVRALDPRDAKEAVEPVVGPQSDEPLS